jgi:predicted GNAT family acetyltransferase
VTALQARPRVLNAPDRARLSELIGADPILNCVLDTRIRTVPNLDARRLGGYLWGVEDFDGGRLRAAVFHGGNVIPVGQDVEALAAIAEEIGRKAHGSSSIVGEATAVSAVWPVLSRFWGPARAIRSMQPLLITDHPSSVPADPYVRPVAPSELARFLPAAVAMFTEELGVSPLAHGGAESYRARVADVIGTGRAFARFDERGDVMFKAEIGALGRQTAQVQGVWVRPELRGAGLGTAAMAAVIEYALQRAPSISLYVNDFNEPARRVYDKLGMRQVNTLSTVLL